MLRITRDTDIHFTAYDIITINAGGKWTFQSEMNLQRGATLTPENICLKMLTSNGLIMITTYELMGIDIDWSAMEKGGNDRKRFMLNVFDKFEEYAHDLVGAEYSAQTKTSINE